MVRWTGKKEKKNMEEKHPARLIREIGSYLNRGIERRCRKYRGCSARGGRIKETRLPQKNGSKEDRVRGDLYGEKGEKHRSQTADVSRAKEGGW